MSNSEKWLKEYENIEKSIQKISQAFNERGKYPKSSTNYTKITGQLRTQLGKFDSSIISLNKTLDDLSDKGNITHLEKNRRSNLLNQLKINQRQFEQMLRDESSAQKENLIDFEGSSLMATARETNETLNFSSDQLLLQHDRIISEQDRGLETLSHIVQNQKRIATTIGNEVDRQNDLIDSMGDKMEDLNERLIKETRSIRIFSKKSGTCGIWLLIVLLLIAIIVIAAIPK